MKFINTDGFTLIELLVVILIIGILIAVAAPSFLGQQEKAKKSGAQQDVAVAYKAAKAFSVDATPQGSFAGFDNSALILSEPQLSGKVVISGASATGIVLTSSPAYSGSKVCVLTVTGQVPSTTCG